jgi:hypothetical protein
MRYEVRFKPTGEPTFQVKMGTPIAVHRGDQLYVGSKTYEIESVTYRLVPYGEDVTVEHLPFVIAKQI